MKIVLLGIGTNLGNRERNLELALSGINENIGNILQSSLVYESEPWGFQTYDEFLNMVIKVETKLSPYKLLEKILVIESSIGRIRGEERYLSRVIDIDIIFYEDLVINAENLNIPHPLMHERRFVLLPLCEIVSDLVHPVFKKPIASLLESCIDNGRVKMYRQQDNAS